MDPVLPERPSIRGKRKTDSYQKARTLLKEREGDVAKGVPFSPAMGRMKFDEAMTDIETEYTVNKRDSVDHLKHRTKLHLMPWFRGRRMTKVTTADINAYVQRRQEQGASRGDHQPRARDPEACFHACDSGRQAAAGAPAVYRRSGLRVAVSD